MKKANQTLLIAFLLLVEVKKSIKLLFVNLLLKISFKKRGTQILDPDQTKILFGPVKRLYEL